MIIDKLGEGGMGTVWKAEDTTLDRLVALKTLSGTLAGDPESRERFVREAQAASALNHPNITTVHDLLEDEGEHLICMEYVDGKTARDMLESGRVGVKKAVEIILQVAEALETAHRQGILHRDIKSSNIMVTMEGRVKVLDFGLAYLEERSQLTRTGTTMGTLAYSSPEQLIGAGYDQRSEIWALGVVFYELLTARLPFVSPSEGELVFSIINNEQEPLSQLREDIPDSVSNIILRMLEKDPGERYQSCSELIGDLKLARGNLETSTVGQQISVSTQKRQIKPATWITLASLAATVAVVLIIALPRYQSGMAIVVPFHSLDPTQSETLESFSNRGVTQVQQLLNESGLVSGIDLYQFENDGSSHQSLSEQDARRIAHQHRADLIITASSSTDSEDLEIHPFIYSRRRDRSWTLPTVRGSATDTRSLMTVLCGRIEGMVACIQDPEYRVLAPLVGYPPSYDAFRAMKSGLHIFFSGGLRDAVPTFDKILMEYPEYANPLLWRIRIAAWDFQTAEYDSLFRIFDQGNFFLETQEKAFLRLLRVSRTENREDCYQEALELYRLAPGTYWNYEAAKWATLNFRPKEAIRYLKSIFPEADLLRNSPDATRWFLTLAYNMLGKHKQALRTMTELRELDIEPQLYYEVISLGAMGELEQIGDRFQESLAQYTWRLNVHVPVLIGHPRGTPGGLMIVAGTRLREYGYFEESRDALHQAIEWYSASDPEFYKPSIAEAHYWTEEWDEAKRLFQEIVDHDPNNKAAHIRLGTLAARIGDEDQARSTLEYLASRSQSESEDIFWMACISALLGEKDSAVTYLLSWLDSGLNMRDDIQRHIDFEDLRGYPNFERIFELKG